MEPSSSTVEAQIKIALEISRNEYQSEISRFRDLDSKLNMMIVLAVGILAAMGIVISSSTGDTASVCVKILLGVVSLLLFIAVVTIIIGLLPQKYSALDIAPFASKSEYNKDSIEFILSYISAYKGCCKSVQKRNHVKCVCIKIAVVILSIAFLTLLVTTNVWIWR